MKKLLTIAAVASFLILGGQTSVDAATVENFNVPNAETQELGWWSHFRDKHILGRETENERNDRKEWERRHRYRDDYRDDHRRDHRDDHRHGHHQPPHRR